MKLLMLMSVKWKLGIKYQQLFRICQMLEKNGNMLKQAIS